MEASIQFDPSSETQYDYLIALAQAISNPRSTHWRNVADRITAGFAANFEREGSGDGGWAPLKPSTVRQRERRGYGGAHPILIQSGDLLRSYIRRDAPGHIEQLNRQFSGWSVSVGSSHPLASLHDVGRGNIPARAVVPLTAADASAVLDVIDQMIVQIERAVR